VRGLVSILQPSKVVWPQQPMPSYRRESVAGATRFCPRTPNLRVGAEAAALYELLNPGTILETGVGGDPEKQRALQDFIEAAGEAFARGDLRLQKKRAGTGLGRDLP